MLDFVKESIGESVHSVRFTTSLESHAACLSSEGALSLGMEKALNRMPGMEQNIKAELVLEINLNHPIAEKIKALFDEDKDKLSTYSKIIYSHARLVSGLEIENPAETMNLVTALMVE